MSFEETLESTSFDGGRKYILYIRRSTEKEKEYFESFNRGRITQIETNQITNRASDWYPIETNLQLSNNLLHYATLFNTTVVELEEVDEDTDTSKIEIDPCGLCRTITKTKEENNRKREEADGGFASKRREEDTEETRQPADAFDFK